MIKFPKYIEDLTWRNYLIHLYTNSWKEFQEMSPDASLYMKFSILQDKLFKMEDVLRGAITNEDMPDVNVGAINRALNGKLSSYQTEPADELRKWEFKDMTDMERELAGFLINSKIMDYAKKTLGELGVKVIKTESGNIVFADKETGVVIYKSSKMGQTASL